jgi:hypothetical protein
MKLEKFHSVTYKIDALLHYEDCQPATRPFLHCRGGLMFPFLFACDVLYKEESGVFCFMLLCCCSLTRGPG